MLEVEDQVLSLLHVTWGWSTVQDIPSGCEGRVLQAAAPAQVLSAWVLAREVVACNSKLRLPCRKLCSVLQPAYPKANRWQKGHQHQAGTEGARLQDRKADEHERWQPQAVKVTPLCFQIPPCSSCLPSSGSVKGCFAGHQKPPPEGQPRERHPYPSCVPPAPQAY